MVQFILERSNEAKLEPYNDVNEHFVNDVIEYATILDSRLRLDMFEGDNPLFPNFNIQREQKWIDFYGGVRVYEFGSTRDYSYVFRKKDLPPKVEEMTKYYVLYDEKWIK